MSRERQRREKLGHWAEFLAANYLRLKGYRILEKRFKTKQGEIDLIAARKGLLVMVEVKARNDLKSAREAVTYASQQRIKKAAQLFLERNSECRQLGVRFDAMFLIKRRRIVHVQDFFR